MAKVNEKRFFEKLFDKGPQGKSFLNGMLEARGAKMIASAVGKMMQTTAQWMTDSLAQGRQLLPNGNFEVQTKSTLPPDSWTLETGTWGTDATANTTLGSYLSGARGVEFLTTGNAVRLVSDYVTVAKASYVGSRYLVRVRAIRHSSTTIEVGVACYDETKTYLSDVKLDDLEFSVQDFCEETNVFTASDLPSSTAYVRVYVEAPSGVATTSTKIDRVEMEEAYEVPSFRAKIDSGGQTITNLTTPHIKFTGEEWDKGQVSRSVSEAGHYVQSLSGGTPYFQAPHDGIYSFSARVELNGLFTVNAQNLYLYKNAAPSYSGFAEVIKLGSIWGVDNRAGAQGTALLELNKGDRIAVYCYQDSGADRTINTSTNDSWFMGHEVTV